VAACGGPGHPRSAATPTGPGGPATAVVVGPAVRTRPPRSCSFRQRLIGRFGRRAVLGSGHRPATRFLLATNDISSNPDARSPDGRPSTGSPLSAWGPPRTSHHAGRAAPSVLRFLPDQREQPSRAPVSAENAGRATSKAHPPGVATKIGSGARSLAALRRFSPGREGPNRRSAILSTHDTNSRPATWTVTWSAGRLCHVLSGRRHAVYRKPEDCLRRTRCVSRRGGVSI
jgi:hypothetical protein